MLQVDCPEPLLRFLSGDLPVAGRPVEGGYSGVPGPLVGAEPPRAGSSTSQRSHVAIKVFLKESAYSWHAIQEHRWFSQGRLFTIVILDILIIFALFFSVVVIIQGLVLLSMFFWTRFNCIGIL